MKYIPLSVPNLKGKEKEYVIDAIDKEWVSTAGAYITRLEGEIAKYVGVKGAVACQSGTAGLHLALRLSEVGQGDEVLVPTLTFIAAVNPVYYMSAHPVFMDCDHTLTLDGDKLEKFIETECAWKENQLINIKTNRQIKAIIVVHVFGNCADMEKIMDVAKKYHLKVIEDATEALGSYFTQGRYHHQFLGTVADFGVYSFNGNKIITTGGGGMLVAKDSEHLKRAKYLSTQAKDDELYYLHHDIGYNYRMTNIQAAIGVAQLEQLEQFIKTKTQNYYLYKTLLADCDAVEILPFSEEIRANYWFYSLLLKTNQLSIDEMIAALENEGIQTRPIWGLIHEQKPYLSEQSYAIEQATYYKQRIINIPCSSNLSAQEVTYVAEKIKNLFK